jgi:DNA ligase 1
MPLFKPMLALSKLPDFRMLRFPLYVSPKLDGVRTTVQGGQLLSRSLKPIPNKNVQDLFRNLPDGTDGELIHGKPYDDPYRRTVSVVMSDDKPADGIQLYIFDRFAGREYAFETRFAGVRSLGLETQFDVVIVPHFPVNNVEELEKAEQEFLARGYEGLMIRSLSGPYKQGRSTEAEGYLMKVKRFADAEARVIGTYEEMENQNAEFTNELGRTARSSHKAGKVGKNRLGGFHVRGMIAPAVYAGVEFDVASGAIDHATRQQLWADRDAQVGRIVVYKYFPTGGDTRPRHPIFKGFRDARDLS